MTSRAGTAQSAGTVVILILGLLTTVPGLIPQSRRRSRSHDRQPGLELGPVELLGLSGQARVARETRTS